MKAEITGIETRGDWRWIWQGALGAFLLAGTTGALMRYWMMAGFPAGLNFVNVRHAHSHLMYFGWVTPALMALIAARLPVLTGRRNPPGFGLAAGSALLLAGLSYLPFLIWGYGLVSVGGKEMPLAVIVSSLSFLPWGGFARVYLQAGHGVQRSVPLRLWDAALIFLGLATAGAVWRAFLAVRGVEDAFLGLAAVHVFLDLFSDGWLALALLGLAYAVLPEGERRAPTWSNRLVFAGLPATFLLGVPLHLVPEGLRVVAGAGGLLVAVGLGLHLRTLWSGLVRSSPGWGLPLAFLALKALMLAGVSLPAVADWGERMGLRVLYLHVFLLGFASLGLLASEQEAHGKTSPGIRRWLSAAVLFLLASLVPLTGLWPAGLSGRWALAVAALAAWGPVATAVYALLARKKIRESGGEGRQASLPFL